MARFLLIVAMFCAIGAAGLGFFNRDKLTRINQELAASVDRTKKLQAKLDELQKAMQQMGQQIESQERANEQQRDAINSDLASTKTKLAQLTDQITGLQKENQELSNQLADARRNLDQKKQAEDDRQSIAVRLINVENTLNQLRLNAASTSKNKGKTPITLEGTVLSMNRDAQALMVSLGSDLGVTPNMHLTVEKNGQTVGQLRVVSVDKNSCVAQFVSDGPENFARVSVGDPVSITVR
jgi:predicted RNase H-like nuclease (RuvC/YqgF family)